MVTQLIGILSVIFWLPDVKARVVSITQENGDVNSTPKPEMTPNHQTTPDSETIVDNVTSPKDIKETQISLKKPNFCADFFDPSHIKDVFNVLKVARPDNKRKILLFVVLLNTVVCGTFGEEDLYILYGRKALNWTTEFSVFVSYYTVTGILGTGIAILVFSKWLKMSDPMLAIISILGSITANPILVSILWYS